MKYLIALMILLAPSFAMAETIYKRAEDTAATITFPIFDTDGVTVKVDATCATGDIKCTCDEAAEANATNCFVDEGSKYSLALSSGEMGCARFSCAVIDQGTAAYLADSFTVETYGPSGTAQHNTTLSAMATDTVSAASVSQAAAEKIGAESSGGGGGGGPIIVPGE